MALGDGVTWAESLPDNSTLAHQIDDYNRDLRVGTRSRMAREHVWSSSQTATSEAGHHQFITFQQQTGAPTITTALTQVGAIYVGSSGDGYPLTFENSAGSAIVIVNSAGNIPVINSGTLGGIPICSSDNPNGLSVLSGPTSTTATTYLLVSSNNSTGGVQAVTWATKDATTGLGAWVDKSTSYGAQQATTNGFVVGYATQNTTVLRIAGYTDSSITPSTVRWYTHAESVGGDLFVSICMPVKKGDYWKVDFPAGSPAVHLYWIPLGN